MTYDPDLRRDTPLAAILKQRIAHEGPLTIAQYMHACLLDESHGYYRNQTAIGAQGDFITAPEISQVFGELIGLWCAVVWQQMGQPRQLNLVELGPGRGTLIKDALRAIQIAPDFAAAIELHLVERSTPLRALQRGALKDVRQPVAWHEHIADLPPGPCIVIANEFLDVQPIEQFVRQSHGWHRRSVSLDDNGQLCFADLSIERKDVLEHRLDPNVLAGSLREISDSHQLLHALVRHADAHPFAALILDYGYVKPQTGETLQAVRNHKFEHPLTSPGEADLTAHVDFHAAEQKINTIADDIGIALNIDGPVTQAEFLGRLGIAERASKLMTANPEKASEIEISIARLMAPQGMGGRFKVIGVRSRALSPLPGLTD